MKTPSTDRRASERFDVVGPLWGQLELPEPATVVNVSSAGLLIETALRPVLDSVHAVRILVDGDAVSVDAVVRHSRPGLGGRHRIGLEFVTVPTTVLVSIEQLGAGASIEVLDSEASRS
ncbi:MAG: PilZ domain-containing protein [Vicinamibacterales bacterium]